MKNVHRHGSRPRALNRRRVTRAALGAIFLICIKLLSTSASAWAEGELHELANFDFNVGADFGVLMRQEAGGNRTPLPTFRPRLTIDFDSTWGISSTYAFSWATESNALSAFTQYHRFELRPQVSLRAKTTALVAAAGPCLQIMHSSFSDGSAASIAATTVRPGVSAGVALQAELSRVNARLGIDGAWANHRLDFLFSLGLTYNLGGI